MAEKRFRPILLYADECPLWIYSYRQEVYSNETNVYITYLYEITLEIPVLEVPLT